jgi:two-component system NtrC family response regulator
VVAATHRDLEAMVVEGSFREDLFYRLKGMILRTPALAERSEDIAVLASLFLRRTMPKKRGRLTADAIAWLGGRSWPGNVRELQSLIDCAAALADRGGTEIVIDADALRFAQGDVPAAAMSAPGRRSLDDEIATLETRMIREALAESGNNRSEAARLLGISRVGLLKKLDRLGLR